MSEWQPIETAPKDQIVLLFVPNLDRPYWMTNRPSYQNPPGYVIGQCYDAAGFGDGWVCDLGTTDGCPDPADIPVWIEPTHWMPLSEPPRSET